MSDEIRVLVCGAGGKMGKEVCRAVMAEDGLVLAGGVDSSPVFSGKDIGEILGAGAAGVEVFGDLTKAIEHGRPDVMVDFTHPAAVLSNIETALANGVHCVIGTTGINNEYGRIEEWAIQYGRNAFVAPNFTTGAVLMMHMAKIAAKYFPGAEVIEFHHDQKADAPSGTAIATAIEMAREGGQSVEVGKETYDGARGARVDGVRVHSVRLPGYVAHQEVIFGSPGQTLSIRHDSIDRAAYMPGVVLAVKKISELGRFTVGLEKIMDL